MTLENREGQRIPDITFRTRQNHNWQDVSSAELFKGKNVIVFSLPGAFTPTCSSAHVPRYNQLVDAFKTQGIDEVICISVNDAFVMDQWQADQNAWNLRFLPDGNGAFTQAMGMLVDKEDLGFGRRSWRYSMLVKDGVVDKMFIEPDEPGDPFVVSDADTMLNYIAPESAPPLDVSVLTRPGCPYCVSAKQALDDAGIGYETLELKTHISDRTLRAVAGTTSYPQVFVNGTLIGGADDLELWLQERKAA